MASNGGDGQQKVRRPILQGAQCFCPVVQGLDWSTVKLYKRSMAIARLAIVYDETL